MGLLAYKNNKIILFHIAKCAGTSLQYFFGNEQPHEKAHQPIGRKIAYDKPYCLWEKANYEETAANPPPIPEDRFVVGCVRNTYDQIVSHYSYNLKRQILPANSSFFSYVNTLCNKKEKHADYYHCQQKRLITIDNDLLKADYILNFHSIDRDMEELCAFLKKQYGYNYSAKQFNEIYHVNRTKHNDYRRYYTGIIVEKIKNLFHEDIECFGWDFQKPQISKNTGFTEHWKNRTKNV